MASRQGLEIDAADHPERAAADPRFPGRFEHEALAVVLQVRDRRLHSLLWRRAQEPFADHWALPGGALAGSERLGSSIGRHLAAKVDLTDIGFLEQLETRSDVHRDPRGRVIATAYIALVATDLNPTVPDDTAWFPVEDLPPTAFDHASIVQSGRERLRAKLTYTNVAFALVPANFTIAELRVVYEACLGHSISPTNLQRVLSRRDIIESTKSVAPPSSSGGRPATIYRFKERTLRVTDPFAAFRPPARKTDPRDGVKH
ncbi:MAG TPA: NUDIX domain-containing protein [Acidimicrobiales bacterium]|nr:NUDIX domain-containing protein [Acidimicrobiales bacterium]